MFLLPGTSHFITWQKQNLLDTATYYVRAVIRDVSTNSILDTINLTDQGSSQRFSGTWDVVQDPTGLGREISIVKTIYEDSGYTQVSGAYGAWEDRYTIYQFKNLNTGGGTATSTLDYSLFEKIIRKIIQLELKQLPKPEKIDLSNIQLRTGNAEQTLENMVREVSEEGSTLVSTFKHLTNESEKSFETMADKLTNATKQLSEIARSIVATNTSISTLTNKSIAELKEYIAGGGAKIQKDTAKNLTQFLEQMAQFEKVIRETAKESIVAFNKNVEAARERPIVFQIRSDEKIKEKEPPKRRPIIDDFFQS